MKGNSKKTYHATLESTAPIPFSLGRTIVMLDTRLRYERSAFSDELLTSRFCETLFTGRRWKRMRRKAFRTRDSVCFGRRRLTKLNWKAAVGDWYESDLIADAEDSVLIFFFFFFSFRTITPTRHVKLYYNIATC